MLGHRGPGRELRAFFGVKLAPSARIVPTLTPPKGPPTPRPVRRSSQPSRAYCSEEENYADAIFAAVRPRVCARTARSLKVSFRCRPAITFFRRHFVHTLTKTSPYPANGIPVRAHVLVRIKFAPKAASVKACPTLRPNADTLGVRLRGRSEDSKTMTDKIV